MRDEYMVLYGGYAWGPFPSTPKAMEWADEKIGKEGWRLIGPMLSVEEFDRVTGYENTKGLK